MQRGAPIPVPRVGVPAAVQHRVQHVDVAAERGDVRGGEAQTALHVWVGSERHQPLGDDDVAPLRRDVQRGASVPVDLVEVRSAPVRVVYRARVPRLRGARGGGDVAVSSPVRVAPRRRPRAGLVRPGRSLEGGDGVVSVVEGEGPEAHGQPAREREAVGVVRGVVLGQAFEVFARVVVGSGGIEERVAAHAWR